MKRFAVLLVAPAVAALGFAQVKTPADAAKIAAARSDLITLKSVLDLFHKDLGRYPTTKEGLAIVRARPASAAAGWRGPYVTKLPNDPWGNPYWYVATDRGFAIASFGADGKPGGTGADQDLAVSR